MVKKIFLTAVLVLLVSLAVAGLASAATPRGIQFSGFVTSIDRANHTFELTYGAKSTTFHNHWATVYDSHPSCQVNSFSELLVGNTVGVYSYDVGGVNETRAVIVFPGVCPQNN